MTLYEKLKAAGVPLDNHESDLYAKATDDARRIIAEDGTDTARVFRSQADGELWFDIPFAFAPYWESRKP